MFQAEPVYTRELRVTA